MAKKTEYHEMGWAEIKVDCYTGRNCDKHKPYWSGFFEGDRDGGEIGNTISLSVKHFPPGTRITVEQPCCPKCHEQRGLCEPYDGCDFNWKDWEEAMYS